MDKDQERLLVAERAAEWLLRLETASPQERAEFWRWLRESPLHVREVLLAQAVDTALGNMLGRGDIDIAELLSCASNVYQIEPP